MSELWKSIRGVGQPPTHRYSHDELAINHVPGPAIDDGRYMGLELTERRHLTATTPNCQRCGLPALAQNYPAHRWWCEYCLEEVRSPMNPNAMIPDTYSTATHLLPSLSDPYGEQTCRKCAKTLLPKLDNSGFSCPSCGETHRPPPAPRASPTNGF